MLISTSRMPAQKCAALCEWFIANPDTVEVRNFNGEEMKPHNFNAVLDLAQSMSDRHRWLIPFDTTIEGPDDVIMWLKMKFL